MNVTLSSLELLIEKSNHSIKYRSRPHNTAKISIQKWKKNDGIFGDSKTKSYAENAKTSTDQHSDKTRSRNWEKFIFVRSKNETTTQHTTSGWWKKIKIMCILCERVCEFFVDLDDDDRLPDKRPREAAVFFFFCWLISIVFFFLCWEHSKNMILNTGETKHTSKNY